MDSGIQSDFDYDMNYMDGIVRQLNIQSVANHGPSAPMYSGGMLMGRAQFYYKICSGSGDGSLDQAAYGYFGIATMGQR
jgi:hypothetical protein